MPGGGANPGLTPGTRPAAGTGAARPGVGLGTGIGQLPASPRPGVGGGPGVGNVGAGVRPGAGPGGAGISQLPAGQRPGGGALAGAIGGSTALLPGMGNRLPNSGERPGQFGNRTPQQRRDDLQNRLSNRDDRPQDRQDRRDDVRQDWQGRYDNFHDLHNDWHHGNWDHYGDWWSHMWDDHTALMAFGTTMWGVNAAANAFGYWGYSNPYYTESGGGSYVDYSQPIVMDAAPMEQAAAAAAAATGAPAPGMTDFDAARQAFYQGDYAGALASTNKALAAMPNDPIIHEFRALVMFAQGKYQEAAAGLYSVLSVGPGWDWTTLSSLYPDTDTYTKQLRALEAYVNQNRQASDARFVLAYHYMTLGSKDAAAQQYQVLYKQSPQDQLVKQLLLLTGGSEALGAPATAATPPAPQAPTIAAADLVGSWNAAGSGGAKFGLELSPEGGFSWTYGQAGKSQSVKGVYALNENVLALEPESGGTMLAQVTQPQGGSFGFQLLGAPPGDPGLKFVKSR